MPPLPRLPAHHQNFPRARWLTLCLALLLTGQAFPARASFENSFWQFTLGVDGYYSTNVNYAAGNAANSALYAVYRPRFSIRPQAAFGEFSMDAGIAAYTFADSGLADKILPDAGVNLAFRLGRRMRLSLSDRFYAQPIEFSRPAETPANLTSVNRAGVNLHYDAPLAGRNRLTLGMGYEAVTLIDLPNDSYNYRASASIERRLSPKTRISLTQGFSQTRFYDGFIAGTPVVPLYTLTTLTTTATVNYRTGPRLETHMGAGVSFARIASRTLTNPAANGGIIWTPNNRLKMAADLSYAERTDSRGTAVRLLSLNGKAGYQLTRKIGWGGSATYSRASLLVLPTGAGGNPDSAFFSITTGFSYPIRKELSASAGYTYFRGLEANRFSGHVATTGLKLTL